MEATRLIRVESGKVTTEKQKDGEMERSVL